MWVGGDVAVGRGASRTSPRGQSPFPLLKNQGMQSYFVEFIYYILNPVRRLVLSGWKGAFPSARRRCHLLLFCAMCLTERPTHHVAALPDVREQRLPSAGGALQRAACRKRVAPAHSRLFTSRDSALSSTLGLANLSYRPYSYVSLPPSPSLCSSSLTLLAPFSSTSSP